LLSLSGRRLASVYNEYSDSDGKKRVIKIKQSIFQR
jgi:hypothetical protein